MIQLTMEEIMMRGVKCGVMISSDISQNNTQACASVTFSIVVYTIFVTFVFVF